MTMADFLIIEQIYEEILERTGYGNKAKNFIFTKDFTGKNQ